MKKKKKNQTSSAVGLSLGSNARSLSRSLRAEGSAFGNLCENRTGCFLLMVLRYRLAFSLRTREMVSMEGVPRRSVIKSSWWTTFFPGNKGFPVKTSANMQPMLQISMAEVYCKCKCITWLIFNQEAPVEIHVPNWSYKIGFLLVIRFAHYL